MAGAPPAPPPPPIMPVPCPPPTLAPGLCTREELPKALSPPLDTEGGSGAGAWGRSPASRGLVLHGGGAMAEREVARPSGHVQNRSNSRPSGQAPQLSLEEERGGVRAGGGVEAASFHAAA